MSACSRYAPMRQLSASWTVFRESSRRPSTWQSQAHRLDALTYDTSIFSPTRPTNIRWGARCRRVIGGVKTTQPALVSRGNSSIPLARDLIKEKHPPCHIFLSVVTSTKTCCTYTYGPCLFHLVCNVEGTCHCSTPASGPLLQRETIF